MELLCDEKQTKCLKEKKTKMSEIKKQEKKSEKQKLKQKYKEEKRAAEKELKHNTAFISKQKNEKQIRLDAERKRKVNQIMSGLEQQEGDVRKIKKKSYKLFD